MRRRYLQARRDPRAPDYWGEIQIFAGSEGEFDGVGDEGESVVAGGDAHSTVGGEGKSDGVAVVASLTSMSET